MTLKRFICSCGIILIISMTFITGYTKSVDFVYADSTTDGWMNVTTNEQLVEAFKYYCKSRDVTINGGVADAVTHFTTKAFNGTCNFLGIDVTALQAQLKYQTDGNIGTRFLFTAVGIDAYNRIFAQFLQDNNLSVGDENVDKTVESGMFYSGLNGNGFVYIVSTTNNNNPAICYLSAKGTKLKYDYAYERTAGSSIEFVTTNNTYRANVVGSNNTSGGYSVYDTKYTLNNYVIGTGMRLRSNNVYLDHYFGDICYFYDTRVQKLYSGIYSESHTYNNNSITRSVVKLEELNSSDAPQTTVTINSTVINNNTYEGDTIINNNGTTGGDDNPDPDPDPDYNPYPDGGGGTTPPTNTGGGSGEDDGTITFPDFDFHLPEINWSLGDLSEKFPFSIPFDLIAFFTVLNAEPQAPAIDADIPLGSWYTWHFEADFSQFDNYAVIIRNVEFIGFCVGLIYLTIKLVKG